ncbi:MAG: type III pantothenate kinase [Planctomycetota bacterium]|nr:MAG: type III pantothenate kinase [Planctomycetota bacterium]
MSPVPVAAPLLLDLGNRRLKLAEAAAGCPAAIAARPLPEEADEAGWSRLRGEVAERAAGRAVRASVVRPRAWERLRPALAGAASLRLAGEDGWPMPVRSRGTGADRVLAAWAAWRRCRRALVVVDLGTAWTLDVVDGRGVFRGGAIGPGLGLQESALAAACPHLPAPAAEPPEGIPADSAAAVAAGTRRALAAALSGLRSEMAARLGEAELPGFLTGGDAARLAPLLGPTWTPAEDLVLAGLAAWNPDEGT